LVQCAVSLFVGTATTERAATQVALAVERVRAGEYQARAELHDQLIHLNASLAEANTRLEESNRDKDQLLRREQIARASAESATEQVSQILESITDGFIALDSEWCFTYLNREAAMILGRPVEALLGKNLWEELPELDGTSFGQLYRQAVAASVSLELEDFYPPFEAWFAVRAYPSQAGLSLYFRDITKRRRLEEEVYRREQEFKALVENSPDIIARIDKELRHLYVNPAIEAVTGLSPQEFIGKTHQELGFPLEKYAEWQAALCEVFATGYERVIEFNLPAPNGITRYYQARIVPEFAQDNSIIWVLAVTRDITDLKQIEAALRESEARLRRIVDSNIIGVFFGDLSGNISEANDAFLQMIGYTRQDLLAGRILWHEMTPPEYLDRSYQAAEELRERGVCVPFEKEYIRKDGSRVFILLAGAVFEGSNEEVVCYVLDITKRKHTESERDRALVLEQEARKQAEAANQIKDEFLAVLSHELRSPLNPILGWTKLLRTRKFDEAATARALEIIERNASLQVKLIEDLLDISRILQGKLSLNVSPVNLVSIIEAASDTVRLAAEAKSIQIQSNFDPAVGLVAGDANRLQQVVWNLLSNAIKFTPAGGHIQIDLGLEDRNEEKKQSPNPKSKIQNPKSQYAEIRVSDTGIGIGAEFLPYVFEHFRQADASITRKHGGLGLGLAIVRQLVEMHGGTIQAESPGEGQGATFIVRLPLMNVQPSTNEVSEISDNLTDLNGVRVLVVDDDTDTREFIAFVLEEYGALTTAVASAGEALEALSSLKIDVLVSDIGMPEEDGYTLIRKLRMRSPDEGGGIPAVAVTAYAREEDTKLALLAGFQMHISKPVDPAELASVVAGLVRVPLH
ncbi:MAG TPA: PAS domain S-box protein, partial [Candidatus Obscuribacterales bacterium]